MSSENISVKFPVFALKVKDNKVYVAGGGGNSKSGVKNSIVQFAVSSANTAKDGSLKDDELRFEELAKYETPADKGAVMNLDLHGNMLAAGIDDFCYLYDEHPQSVQSDNNDNKDNQDGEDNNSWLTLRDQKRSDMKEAKSKYDESYQKVVRFNDDGHLLATGGTDGVLRLWDVNSDGHHLHLKSELKKHSGDIDDLSFAYITLDCGKSNDRRSTRDSGVSEMNQIVASVSAEQICIWNVDDAKIVHCINRLSSKDRFKFCRLVEVEFELYLYTAHIDEKKHGYVSCYAISGGDSVKLLRQNRVSLRPVTCMTVIAMPNVEELHSQLHVLIICGNADGDVLFIDGETLRVFKKYPTAHGFSVTAITSGQIKVGNQKESSQQLDYLIVSGSADYSVKHWLLSQVIQSSSGALLDSNLMMLLLSILVLLVAVILAQLYYR
ncbi:hypothetical protein MIR68_004420 [Amoeboaphelidium protococcarum]|nr:hypothetical protein MIR68_004420 [Amoeboaphelidium protococcarum]